MTNEKEKFVRTNPLEITHMRRLLTLKKKPYIGMYSGALPHPVVSLPPHQYHMLTAVGVDPNQITDEDTYCSLLVWWEETGELNSKGNPYITATRIEGNMHDPVVDELKTIRFLLTVLAENAVGGHEALMEIWRERHGNKDAATNTRKTSQKPPRRENGGDKAGFGADADSKPTRTMFREGTNVSVQGKTETRKGVITAELGADKFTVEFEDGSQYDIPGNAMTALEF